MVSGKLPTQLDDDWVYPYDRMETSTEVAWVIGYPQFSVIRVILCSDSPFTIQRPWEFPHSWKRMDKNHEQDIDQSGWIRKLLYWPHDPRDVRHNRMMRPWIRDYSALSPDHQITPCFSFAEYPFSQTASGKLLHSNVKSPCLMGKPIINGNFP